MTRIQSLTSMLVVVCAVGGLAGCDGDSGMSPSPMPRVIEGTIDLEPSTVAVIPVQVTGDEGRFSSHVQWNSPSNDIDSGILEGTCSGDQIEAGAAGCAEEDALGFDGSLDKPSVFTAPVTAGAHTVVLINLGPGADTLTYRFEIN